MFKILVLGIIIYFSTTLFYFVVKERLYLSNSKINWIFDFKDQKLECVFLGTSRTKGGIIPNEINNCKCYNFGVEQTNIADHLAILEILKSNNVIIENLYYIYEPTILVDESIFDLKFHAFFYLKYLNSTEISNLVSENSTTKDYLLWKYLPISRIITYKDLLTFNSNKEKYNADKGYIRKDNVMSTDQLEKYTQYLKSICKMNKPKISSMHLKNLDKMFNYFQNNITNTKLILLPFYKDVGMVAENDCNFDYYNSVSVKMAEKYNIEVIDYWHNDYGWIGKIEYYADPIHLNHNGALKMTKLVETKLNKCAH